MVVSSQVTRVARKLPMRMVMPTSMLTVTASAATARLVVCSRTARLRTLKARPSPRGRTGAATVRTTSGTTSGRLTIITKP